MLPPHHPDIRRKVAVVLLCESECNAVGGNLQRQKEAAVSEPTHTAACWAMPECSVCHMRKAPVGRSVAPAAANGYCNHECEGYRNGPQPGHFWPGEEA